MVEINFLSFYFCVKDSGGAKNIWSKWILLLCKSFRRCWWVLTVNETRGSLATNLQIKYLSKIFEIYCTLEWCIVMATHLNIKTESNICLKYLSDIRHIRLEWCIVTITLLDQLLATIVTNALRWLTEKPFVPNGWAGCKNIFCSVKKNVLDSKLFETSVLSSFTGFVVFSSLCFLPLISLNCVFYLCWLVTCSFQHFLSFWKPGDRFSSDIISRIAKKQWSNISKI